MMKKQYLAVFSRRHKISTFTPTHVSWLDYGSKTNVKQVVATEKFLFDGVITRKKSLLVRL